MSKVDLKKELRHLYSASAKEVAVVGGAAVNSVANTAVRWFRWSGWFTEKVEAWLEQQAAEGWHLVKADRLLYRFHFVRGTPQTLWFFVDFPAHAGDEYRAGCEGDGWELVDSSYGWYIWRAECQDGRLPEAYRDVGVRLQRNNRLLAWLAVGLALLAAGNVPSLLFAMAKPGAWASTLPLALRQAILGVNGIIAAVLIGSGILIILQNARLRQGKP
ncbi:MAG TPA: DUF2812 domain-containing protein [Sphingobacteriaceae bacterium]|nr:DUF2812 domain-containing protein [Sphingobacteriaceae bacterium]